ncbi:DnaJ family domain-containing protein [Nonomuraea sp. NPDC003214]
MTERKPGGMQFESWVDRQIREAQERGEFDDLPGAGKPLPGADKPYDEHWWIKQKLESEGLSMPLPPSLQLRKDAEQALAAAAKARSEGEVRLIVNEINDRIREAIRTGLSGPPHNLVPYDVERIVSEWRSRG